MYRIYSKKKWQNSSAGRNKKWHFLVEAGGGGGRDMDLIILSQENLKFKKMCRNRKFVNWCQKKLQNLSIGSRKMLWITLIHHRKRYWEGCKLLMKILLNSSNGHGKNIAKFISWSWRKIYNYSARCRKKRPMIFFILSQETEIMKEIVKFVSGCKKSTKFIYQS